MLMIKYIEITLYSDDNINIETVIEELKKLGLRHKRVRKLKEGDFKKNLPSLPQQDKGNKCCEGDEEEKKSLSIIDTGKELLAATGEHIANGLKKVSDEEYQKRIKICGEPCEELMKGFRCRKCKCFMKVKARWDIKNICKLKKW